MTSHAETVVPPGDKHGYNLTPQMLQVFDKKWFLEQFVPICQTLSLFQNVPH